MVGCGGADDGSEVRKIRVLHAPRLAPYDPAPF
jgi:hypothetical protein